MPIVNFVRTRPAAGGDVPATGFFRFRPSRPRVLAGAPDETVLPVPFKALLVGGAVAVNLAPTDVSWAWEVLESVDGIPDVTYYVTVPDASGPLDDPDLTRVSPTTLSPRAVPEAAWWAAVAGMTPPAGAMYVLTDTDGRPYFA